jgi:hypothetical protein
MVYSASQIDAFEGTGRYDSHCLERNLENNIPGYIT